MTKPPAAWKGIPYVEGLGIDLDGLDGPVTLFEGTAREGVPHFPANVNIAAALSLAGIGFDGTRLLVVADPELRFNTHFIRIRGPSGSIDLRFENVPSPDNPRTAMLAGFSALAAFKEFNSPVRYGTKLGTWLCSWRPACATKADPQTPQARGTRGRFSARTRYSLSRSTSIPSRPLLYVRT